MKTFQQFQELAGLPTRNPSASRPQPINRTNDQVQRRELHDKKLSRMNAHKKTTTNKEYYEDYDTVKARQDKFQKQKEFTTPTGTFDTTDTQQNADAAKAAKIEREQLKKEIKRELSTEVYDPEMGTVRGPRAKRSAADRRAPGTKPRVKAVGGGKTAPVDYKPQGEKPNRSRTTSQRTQQPQQERGSAEVKQSYAEKIKADRRAAAKARAAARKSGGEVKSTTTSSKDAEKKADELLKTKKAAPKKTEPAKPRKKYAHADGGGMTRKERDATRNKATGQSRKEAKAQMRSEFEKKHGRKPNKKEAMQMTAKAHAAAKALS